MRFKPMHPVTKRALLSSVSAKVIMWGRMQLDAAPRPPVPPSVPESSVALSSVSVTQVSICSETCMVLVKGGTHD